MLKIDVLELIEQGEGAKLEFKRDDVQPENMAKEIVSFANMNGGTILIGVEDNGNISGIQKKNLQEWLYDTVIGRYISPSITPGYEEVLTEENKKVAVVCIPMGTEKPYVLTHNDREDVYVRYGNVCRLASREQQARLFATGGLVSVETFPIHGSSVAELDDKRVREYFYDILEFDEKEKLEKLLIEHGFLIKTNSKYVCSYFAYVLFSKTPQKRLPLRAGLRLTVYDGIEKEYESRFDSFIGIPMVEYRGDNNVQNPIEDALHNHVYLQSYLSEEIMEGTTRIRQWHYPKEVIREVVVNALVHRDWTKQDLVRVVAYNDRLEVISPGALPNGLTIDRVKSGVTIHRNQHIARVFRDYGYLELQGMGIRRKVIPLMQEKNLVEPEFEATENNFKVILRKAPTITALSELSPSFAPGD